MASFSENAWDALNLAPQFAEGKWLDLRPRWDTCGMGLPAANRKPTRGWSVNGYSPKPRNGAQRGTPGR
jgi:hypothetical protein